MNYEQLAFFNQQLAGMLKSGIPLEGALRRLSAEMSGGRLREEIILLEKDLEGGKSLEEALGARELPAFYSGMIRVGARGNDLAGALTLVADYYSRLHSVWTRLKGLLVYPFLVLLMALGVSVLIAWFVLIFFREMNLTETGNLFGGGLASDAVVLASWFPPLFLLMLLLGLVTAVSVPAVRLFLRWKLPGFREASFANLASALSMLLGSGVTLSEALGVVRELEPSAALRSEMATWSARMSEGRAKFVELVEGSRVVPPLFVWLVANGGEDLAGGFGRAAEIYHARAMYRIEVILYCVMPVSILLLGLMILGQTVPLVHSVVQFMRGVSLWM